MSESTNTERAGRFTKKPVTIDAWLIDFGNKPLPEWVNEAFRTEVIDWCPAGEGLYISTLEGHMLGTNGSWLIKGVQGELYACKPEIFEATYTSASLSLPAAGQEPVAYLWQHGETGRTRIVMPDMIVSADANWQVVGPLCLGAAPQPTVAAGWIASAEQMPPPGERVFWMDKDSRMVGYDTWMGEDFRWTASHWMCIPPAPSTEGESK